MVNRITNPVILESEWLNPAVYGGNFVSEQVVAASIAVDFGV